MKILIAPDKFKNSLQASQVCQAIEEAFRESGISFSAHRVPMADGGEGTCDVLTQFSKGRKITNQVFDPLFRYIEAQYGLSGDGETAFIEMASASGLQLLKGEERNPLNGTTYGTGQLIEHALGRGVKKIILGIGGSGTNDAGIGMAAALGMTFHSSSGEQVKPIGKNLLDIKTINIAKIHPRLKDVSFTALCDVNNPLYGPKGAAYVFAPQKGADDAMVKFLDDGLRNFASVVQQQFNVDINFPGAGAGGGLSGSAKAFFNIQFVPGIDFLIQFVQLEELVRQSDLVITGEGKIDEQTFSGKVVKGVSDLAKKHNKPWCVVAGKSDLSVQQVESLGALVLTTLINDQTTENQAMQNTFALIKQRVKEEIIPLFLSRSAG